MAKRTTDEERIVEFFNTADPAKTETVFNIVKAIVKRRTGAEAKPKATRKAKVATAAPAAAAAEVAAA